MSATAHAQSEVSFPDEPPPSSVSPRAPQTSDAPVASQVPEPAPVAPPAAGAQSPDSRVVPLPPGPARDDSAVVGGASENAPLPASSPPRDAILDGSSEQPAADDATLVADAGPLLPDTEAPTTTLAPRFFPSRLPYEQGDPIPPGYHVEERHRSGLVIGGGAVLGAAYLAGLALAERSMPGKDWLWVPVVGPFGGIMKEDARCQVPATATPGAVESADECSKQVVKAARRVTMLLVDGLVQVAGGSLLVIGVTSKHRELVREHTFLLTPRVARGSYGVELWAQF